MGTPRHAAGKVRKNREDRMELRLTDEEKESFREAAELAGMPLSAWVRTRLRQAARGELEGFGRPVRFLVSPEGRQ